ncbi:interleukin-10 receptor subunit alpha isoform X2 [Pseudophryne corroboree]|uniref:interleukin-10 receptor subunit alpha isoform X2 n=1 Tax=Pseudophryne corroboree TaxID=495146 RepID=UPI003081AC85
MAELCISVLGCALLLSLTVGLWSSSKADTLTRPQNVHFQLGFFNHILSWTHDSPGADSTLYEVEYLSYGGNWTSVPHCTFTSFQYCDLTVETLPTSLGYVARVRSVLGNQTSKWTRTARYTFSLVILPPPYVSLEVDGPSLLVQLSLPKIEGNNITKRYEDVFPYNRVYTIHIRRTEDNHTFIQVKDAESFHLHGLVAGKEYCVRVQPSISSRGNVGEASPEICIHLPEQEVASSTLLAVASGILTFVVLLIFINFLICLYVQEGGKTPKALSLIKRNWSWTDKPSSPVIETALCWENGLIEQLIADPRNSLMRSSADSGFGSHIFDHNMSNPHPVPLDTTANERGISVPTAVSDFKELSIQVESPDEHHQEEDSGISLSTGSPSLKRSSSCSDTPYRENPQSWSNSRVEIVPNVPLGYQKQRGPEVKPNCLENQELVNTWQPQMKDYLSQGPQNQQKDHIEIHLQEECDVFPVPWAQMPEAFQSSVPLTVAFSPFSRVLWDLGVISPSLGDVELMDTRS